MKVRGFVYLEGVSTPVVVEEQEPISLVDYVTEVLEILRDISDSEEQSGFIRFGSARDPEGEIVIRVNEIQAIAFERVFEDAVLEEK